MTRITNAMVSSGQVADCLELAAKSFASGELAYLALTSKIERPLQDRLAWCLHTQFPGLVGNVRISPGQSRSLFFRATRRFGGVARSIAEGLADAASAPAQCRPGIGHPPVGCLYPQITVEEERAALDGVDGGRDIGLLTGNTRCLVVQGPGRAAADDLGYQRRTRGARGDPGPLPAIEYLREPAQALAGMPASLRVEVHSDLAALVRLPRRARSSRISTRSGCTTIIPDPVPGQGTIRIDAPADRPPTSRPQPRTDHPDRPAGEAVILTADCRP